MTDDEFWAHVDVRLSADECWMWLGARTGRNGRYGRVDGETAHRRAWELHAGAFAGKRWVGHTCPNLRCVNPSHLICGTAREVLLAAPNWQRRRRAGGRYKAERRLSA
jgi:hypothetical protein